MKVWLEYLPALEAELIVSMNCTLRLRAPA
jgi:hypothetical protein